MNSVTDTAKSYVDKNGWQGFGCIFFQNEFLLISVHLALELYEIAKFCHMRVQKYMNRVSFIVGEH